MVEILTASPQVDYRPKAAWLFRVKVGCNYFSDL